MKEGETEIARKMKSVTRRRNCEDGENSVSVIV